MFGLLHNLYKFVKAKSQRKLCIVLLGIDSAGKTTLLNTVQGQLDKEVSPTFGFNSTSTTSRSLGLHGRNLDLQIYDLGGGQSMRRVWPSYLADVHAVIFVVDAADSSRFAECKNVLHQTLQQQHLLHKPVLVFANKQDLPTASTAADLANQLGLPKLKDIQFHVLACTAKTPAGQEPDKRICDGLLWLTATANAAYSQLDQRVQHDTALVKQEEARRKRERDERAKKQREERQRERQEAEAAAAAEAGLAPSQPLTLQPCAVKPLGLQLSSSPQHNALSTLPGCIDSPKPDTLVIAQLGPSTTQLHGGPPGPGPLFSDLQAVRPEASRLAARGTASGALDQPPHHTVQFLGPTQAEEGPGKGMQGALGPDAAVHVKQLHRA